MKLINDLWAYVDTNCITVYAFMYTGMKKV